jgi:hypothetical protein
MKVSVCSVCIGCCAACDTRVTPAAQHPMHTLQTETFIATALQQF